VTKSVSAAVTAQSHYRASTRPLFRPQRGKPLILLRMTLAPRGAQNAQSSIEIVENSLKKAPTWKI
jgi:hypothetical protein